MRYLTHDAQSGDVTRIEITREPDQTIRFRRWVNAVLSDDRPATADEEAQVLGEEQEQRQNAVNAAVAAALTQLANARAAGTAEYAALAAIPGATFANNTQRDNAIRQIATSLRVTLSSVCDEMAKVERLLVRAAAGLYDGTD